MPRPRPQSTLRSPLNGILGTAANVRLLRVLSQAETSLSAGELARRAELGRTSIYPALEALEEAGIISFVGAGAQRQVAFRREHPMGEPLANLFRVERLRIETMVTAMRRLLEGDAARPSAVWLEEAGETLACYVVADPRMLAPIVDFLSLRLSDIERMFDVRIQVHGMTRSELASRSRAELAKLENAILLYGVPPTALLEGKRARGDGGHEKHDVRARRLAIAIAAKLRRDPALTHRLRNQLMHRAHAASPQERRELQEWERVFASMPAAQLQRFLIENSERATRLRQTLPALDVLTAVERKAVLASTSDAEARAAVLGRRDKG